MRRPVLVALVATLLSPGLAPAASPSAAPGDTLPPWLSSFAEGRLARAHWGVSAVDLETGQEVVAWNDDRYFVPASNLKLVVAATALETLGPDFTWSTTVHATGPIGADGRLVGDLVLHGTGDPNLSGRYTPSMTAIFESLADSLASAGLVRVEGEVIADESHWDGDHLHSSWKAYDLLWWYAAPVGALGFNDNAIDFHIQPGLSPGDPPVIDGEPASAFWTLENRAVTGPPGATKTFDLLREPGSNRVVAYGTLPLDAAPEVEYFAVVDPAAWAGTVFREVLERRGITVAGSVRTVADPERSPVASGAARRLAGWTSPPLARVVESINGRSQNWHAEQLLRTIGREIAGEGSWEAGLATERRTLNVLDVDTTAFVLRDASGLSSENLATPRGLVELLTAMRDHPHAGVWLGSLSVAAEQGSLRRRFRGTPSAGRVYAKTGFLEHVHALSGYLTTVSGREIAFSVIVNGAGPGGDDAADAIDGLVDGLVSESVP